MEKVTALYFSPTAGTKRAVKMLLDCMPMAEDKELIDNTLPVQREKIYEFGEDELVLVANPVYAGQLPPVDGLWKNLRGSNTPCIIMACYGNRHYENTLAQMRELLEIRGFKVVGAVAAVIPHVFAPKLGEGRPNQEDKLEFSRFAAAVEQKLLRGAKKYLELPGEPQPEPKRPLPVPKDYLQGACNQCGACASLCPVGAINPVTMEIDTASCISCMRCIRSCAHKARSYDAAQIRAWLEGNFSEPRPVEFFL